MPSSVCAPLAASTRSVAVGRPLPGDEAPRTRPRAVRTQLAETDAGQYRGQLRAPRAEGYYRLTAEVKTPEQAPVTLSERITVEREMP